MKCLNIFSIFLFILLFIGQGFSADEVLMDDFEDHYASNPEQCHIGEAYGHKKDPDKIDEGGGYWYIFADNLGSKVLDEEYNLIDTAGSNGEDLFDTTKNQLRCNFIKGIKDGDKYVGLGNGFFGDDDNDAQVYNNFTDLKSITLRMKGYDFRHDTASDGSDSLIIKPANIRVLLATMDIDSILEDGKPIEWGYYGKNIELYKDSGWMDIKIKAEELEPEKYSPPDDSGWTWEHKGGRDKVRELMIQMDVENTFEKDTLMLYIDEIVFKGITAKKAFGFDIGIITLPFIPEYGFANLCITPNVFTNTINISYNLNQASDVCIGIFNSEGRLIFNLVNTRQHAGHQSVTADYNRKTLSSGVYFLRAEIDEKVLNKSFRFVK